MDSYNRIVVRATNWVGDAVMSLPALAAIRTRFPRAHISVVARPWVAGLYRHESFADEIIPYQPERGWRGLLARRGAARELRARHFDCAVLLQNAFDAALLVWLAGVPRRIGYARDGRGLLLTDAIAPPARGSIPEHQSFYYLELLRRVGWLERLPEQPLVRLTGARAQPQALIGLSPGAAFGNAKRWLPERFAEAAATLAAELDCDIALFGSHGERELCEQVREEIVRRGRPAHNYAGETSLEEFIRLVSSCRLMLTNDSGAMHIASALGVPTVTVFGATDHITTGPTGPLARVIRHDVDCSPCMLRECPTDHRCMTAVTAAEVCEVALKLVREKP